MASAEAVTIRVPAADTASTNQSLFFAAKIVEIAAYTRRATIAIFMATQMLGALIAAYHRNDQRNPYGQYEGFYPRHVTYSLQTTHRHYRAATAQPALCRVARRRF
jgi:hypothetical protein